MARQGILAKAKPSAGTNTLLYSAPIDSSASTVLNVTAQGGSNTTFDVALKNYDQKLVVGASNHLLHEGDVVTGYRFALSTAIPATAGLASGTLLTSSDAESTARFESFYLPAFTEIDVRVRSIRAITLESVTGDFAVGETIVKGSGGNTATATIYAVALGSGSTLVYVGPSTLAGTGTEFADGDSLTASGGGTGTISSGGIATAANEFTFQPSGGTENLYLGTDLTLFTDRTYRFDVSDSTMSGRDFKLSTTVNGEYGPDGDFTDSTDNGTEYVTGKTTNGTAGSSGAYVQFDFSQDTSLNSNLYFYDGGTGTAANSAYGGSDRYLATSNNYEYDEIYVYDVDGTWTNNTDGFEFNGTTYTVSSQTSAPYGYVRSYSGTDLYVIKGVGSADFAGSDTFQDNPKEGGGTRGTVTVSSVAVAVTAFETQEVIRKDNAITANTTEEIKSLVIGPGERLIVENAAADCSFVLIGFEDASTGFTTRTYSATVVAGAASGGG